MTTSFAIAQDDTREATTERAWLRRFALPAILLLATAWRVHHLGAQSIWYDEGLSIGIALTPLEQLIESVRFFEQTPPLYHLMLGGWVRVFGDSEFAVRVPSVIASVMAIWATWHLATRAGGFVAACAATTLMALSPFQLHYAQEARGYALFLALSLWSCELFLRLVDGSRRSAIAYVPVVVAMLYTHPFAALVILAQNLALAVLFVRGPKPKVSILRWLALQAVSLLLFAPWLPTQLRWTRSVARTFWIEPFNATEILRSFWAYTDSVFALILLAVFAVVGVRRARDRRIPLLSLMLLATSIVLPVIVSMIVRPMFSPRYGMVCAGALYVLAGAGVAAVRSAWARGLALAAMVALPMIGWLPHPSFIAYEKDDWRGAGRYLQENTRPGDSVAINIPQATVVYNYYVARPDVEVIAFKGTNIPIGAKLRRGANVWLVVHSSKETPEEIIAAGNWRVAPTPTFRGVQVYRLLPGAPPASGPQTGPGI
ncbi:MAG: glycosyltransferase family 39 protein [Tepidisphaeraceae bacterium]